MCIGIYMPMRILHDGNNSVTAIIDNMIARTNNFDMTMILTMIVMMMIKIR